MQAEVGSPARAGVWASKVSVSQMECFGVGLGTPALVLSQMRTGQSEVRGLREEQGAKVLKQVKGKGGRKWGLLGGDGSGGSVVV